MASGKFNTLTKINPGLSEEALKPSKTNPLPSDFNVNMAESSIDFDISESKATFTTPFQGKKDSKKREEEDSQDYMDSGDFMVS